TLIRRAKAAGVAPHILSLTCREYEAIYQARQPAQPGKKASGGVDYDALLRLTSEKLEAGIREVLGKAGAAGADRAIVVYGGALHNDLAAPPGLSAYAFGESIARTV